MISLAPATWAALEWVASAEGTALADLIKDAVHRDLYRRQRARKADKPDERLIAPLRALLAEDFAYAKTWDDLMRRLMAKGYRLVESGPGLIVADHRNGAKVCKASELGYSHARITARMGSAFPAHAHAHILEGRGGSWPRSPADLTPSTPPSPWP